MGIEEENIDEKVLGNKERLSNSSLDRVVPSFHYVSVNRKEELKQENNHSNIKQIFVLAFDALRERKARYILTILMVVVGGGLMIALNGMSVLLV